MNNYKTLYTGLCILLSWAQTPLFAQDNSKSEYIVLNTGDTLYGKVNHIDERGAGREFYKKIRFTKADEKTIKYKREDISALRTNNANYESYWLNQSSQKVMLVNPKYQIDPQNGEQHLLLVVSKGKLSHYELQWFDQGNATLWSMALLKKEEDNFLMRADQGLLGLKKEVLSKYFSNCPELKEGIIEKQLTQVGQVVEFYNNNCID